MPSEPSTSTYRITIKPHDWQFDAAPTETLLMAARRAGIKLPSLCRKGVCRACYSQVLAGQVAYCVDHPGVSRDEREEGFTLPCVALPRSAITLLSPMAERLDAPAP